MIKILLTEKQAEILGKFISENLEADCYSPSDETTKTINRITDKLTKATRKERNLRKELGLA